ncbi:MAG: tetraacyldisaccharide 4'-kinase [Bacteroidales bacterium]|mgnify:CR=1 FL=1|nr:tetraacyldisaccharide 4'-kinase [Bacteroidales bacterium]MDD4670046.1 tetraacyldisaccharide 4'-kinase [Bacteroidales bacterium]
MSNIISKIILSPYYLTLYLRNKLYDNGRFKSYSFDIPVICVGNVTIGGTGKTPMAELIVRILSENKRVAVISRGYKRKSRGFRIVNVDDTAKKSGDEPLQIKRKFPDVIVAVDKNRKRAIEHLLSLPAETRPEVIILDDAFQHRSITPSKSIVLIDYNRPIFKDSLVPFGKLRDIPSEIKRAQAVVITKSPEFLDEWEREKMKQLTRVRNSQKLFFAKVKYDGPQPVFKEYGDNRYIYSKEVALYSGIANDKPLRIFLIGRYEKIHHVQYGDHHNFSRMNIYHIMRYAKAHPAALILTTEKDAQRLLHSKYIPKELKVRLFYIPIETEFLTPEEDVQFKKYLTE